MPFCGSYCPSVVCLIPCYMSCHFHFIVYTYFGMSFTFVLSVMVWLGIRSLGVIPVSFLSIGLCVVTNLLCICMATVINRWEYALIKHFSLVILVDFCRRRLLCTFRKHPIMPLFWCMSTSSVVVYCIFKVFIYFSYCILFDFVVCLGDECCLSFVHFKSRSVASSKTISVLLCKYFVLVRQKTYWSVVLYFGFVSYFSIIIFASFQSFGILFLFRN